MILGQTWFQVSLLLFLQTKSRREVWEGCWILGLFWENFSHLKKCSVLLKNGQEIHWNSKTKTSFQCQPNSLSLKTVNSTHFPRKTWIPRDIPSTQRRSYLLRFQSKLWYIYSCTVRINSCFTTSKKMCHNYCINNHFVQKRTKAFYKNFMYFE